MEKDKKKRSAKDSELAELLRNSEIRDGEFIRYYGRAPELVIPDDIVAIGEKAFAGNRTLRRVTLGKSIGVIRESAFRGCVQLEEVCFSESLVFGFAICFEFVFLLTVLLLFLFTLFLEFFVILSGQLGNGQ